ncbi:11868_t:CDS:2 [Diversispora eburnea]|uniref:11868_t:CDS:1 n=1 Tax=Diversispora eburnea TaxID=1213867 RepID=A0A9N8YRA3_9GLOM|nr:11868_t:CDS:2 [Diversispora eburnea]
MYFDINQLLTDISSAILTYTNNPIPELPKVDIETSPKISDI